MMSAHGAPIRMPTAGDVSNQATLTGQLLERDKIRYTPAGLPVISGKLFHQSEQAEAGGYRQVVCDVPLLALGDAAQWLAATPPNAVVTVRGFLASRSKNSKMLVFHVQTIEFLEGNKNAQILQEER